MQPWWEETKTLYNLIDPKLLLELFAKLWKCFFLLHIQCIPVTHPTTRSNPIMTECLVTTLKIVFLGEIKDKWPVSVRGYRFVHIVLPKMSASLTKTHLTENTHINLQTAVVNFVKLVPRQPHSADVFGRLHVLLKQSQNIFTESNQARTLTRVF